MSKKIALSGLLIALYLVLTVAFAPISYGPIQVRLAAGLYVLAAPIPFVALPLTVATALANWYGGLGVLDLVFGPLATAMACFGCWLFRKQWWLVPAAIPIFSAPIIAGFLSYLFQLPFLVIVVQIFIGQTIAAYTMGLVVLKSYAIFDRGGQGQTTYRVLP